MFIDHNRKRYEIETPNSCPHCHLVIIPQYYNHIHSVDSEDRLVVISTWHCSNYSCRRYFVAEHLENGRNPLPVARFLDGTPKPPNWPDSILNLKSGVNSNETSKFFNTYVQSLKAEKEGLYEIAGVGFRKALEYIIKDWSISIITDENEKESIHKMPLLQVVKKYMPDDIKEITERAVWLGNDQAHYEVIFIDYDIAHLKELIELICADIDRESRKKSFINGINKY